MLGASGSTVNRDRLTYPLAIRGAMKVLVTVLLQRLSGPTHCNT